MTPDRVRAALAYALAEAEADAEFTLDLERATPTGTDVTPLRAYRARVESHIRALKVLHDALPGVLAAHAALLGDL